MLIIISLLASLCVIFIALWLILSLLSLLLGGLAWLLQTPEQRKNQAWRQKRRQLQRYEFHTKAAKAATTSPGYAGLWHQLLIRVNFDIATAERLTSQVRQRYPGKTDRWYIQKAIYDLERDRRR